jgi:hypothetical protein
MEDLDFRLLREDLGEVMTSISTKDSMVALIVQGLEQMAGGINMNKHTFSLFYMFLFLFKLLLWLIS